MGQLEDLLHVGLVWGPALEGKPSSQILQRESEYSESSKS